jgi:hypothetical protein
MIKEMARAKVYRAQAAINQNVARYLRVAADRRCAVRQREEEDALALST